MHIDSVKPWVWNMEEMVGCREMVRRKIPDVLSWSPSSKYRHYFAVHNMVLLRQCWSWRFKMQALYQSKDIPYLSPLSKWSHFILINLAPNYGSYFIEKLLLLLINPNAPPSFKLMFNFLSATRQHARTRACLYDLKLPYPCTDSGKRTFLYSASILFNALDSDCKQLAMSTACTSDASTLRLTTTKRKLRNYFLHKLTCINHLEDLFLRQL